MRLLINFFDCCMHSGNPNYPCLPLHITGTDRRSIAIPHPHCGCGLRPLRPAKDVDRAALAHI